MRRCPQREHPVAAALSNPVTRADVSLGHSFERKHTSKPRTRGLKNLISKSHLVTMKFRDSFISCFLINCDSSMAHKRVKLVSSDGFEFVIDYKAACISKTLNNMLGADGCFTESTLGEIQLQSLSGRVLEEVCRYFYFSLQNQDPNSKPVPQFHVDPAIALDLLMAANFLDT